MPTARMIAFLRLTFVVVLVGGVGVVAALAGVFDIKPQLPPEQYGNVLIDRTSSRRGVKPVIFSHWSHRRFYTCRVCHSELDFSMKANTTEITEQASRAGKFCGACHDGRIAFRHQGNCDRCHTGTIESSADRFAEFTARSLPFTEYGNGIDWVESLRRKLISPATYLRKKASDIPFEKTLFLESDWSIITPTVFPHKGHVELLECGSCHPELFDIKKKSTKNLSMKSILQGEFCGVCHLTVAFPMDDCTRCHPKMRPGGP